MLERGLTTAVHRLLDSTKVVVIEGGRGVGKTTLAQLVAAERDFGARLDLSDADIRAEVSSDPTGFLDSMPRPMLIDEAQLEPEVTVAVKQLVDCTSQPGQFLLTGSARIGRGALGGSDPLAGRAARLRLSGFTQSELAGRPTNPLPEWIHPGTAAPVGDIALAATTADRLAQTMCFGGIPPIALAPDGRRRTLDAAGPESAFVEGYVEGVLHLALAQSRTDRRRLVRAFRYLAANPAQIFVASRAASELGYRAETVSGYLDLCQEHFLLDTAPAHRPTEHRSLTSHPRVFPSDPALGAWAAQTNPSRLVGDPLLFGALLESFVFAELSARSQWEPEALRLGHWRDKRGNEVDLVMTSADGALVGIEVKAAQRVGPADTSGLIAFARQAGFRFRRGIVLHAGPDVEQLHDDVWAVPLSVLF